MSDQFSFDELNLWNWNQSVSLKSYKNPNFTMSEVSSSHPENLQHTSEGYDQTWNVQEFNKKAEKKLKNRANVKNFRQRKKVQQQKFIHKLKILQHENEILRGQRYCKHCKKPFGGLIQMTHTKIENQKQLTQQKSKDQFHGDGKECFQFQKPMFYTKNSQPISNRNGKIWIALGILMMVIGVHLYGFKGKEGYQDISISKIESQRIIDMYEGRKADMGDYFDVKVKYKSKANPKQTEKQHDIFKEIRIYHEEEKQDKNKKYQSIDRQTFSEFQMIEEKNQKGNHYQEFQYQKQEQVKFHRDLLYAMQAQIDQIGHYI